MTDKREHHTAAFCTIKPGDQHFNGSMARHCGQWVATFTCPTCGRQMRIANNYLGRGKLVCTGDRFWRPHEQTFGKMPREDFRALIQQSA